MGRGNYDGRKGCPIVKYRDSVRSSVQKRWNRLRCHLVFGLGWSQEVVLDRGPDPDGKG